VAISGAGVETESVGLLAAKAGWEITGFVGGGDGTDGGETGAGGFRRRLTLPSK
jgi:hypothetical protein